MPEHDPNPGSRRPHEQVWTHASRRYAQWRTQPSWLQRLAGGIVLIVLVGLAAILLVSSLFIGLAVVAVGAAAIGIGALVRRLRGDAPASQGRKNVRVIVRQHP